MGTSHSLCLEGLTLTDVEPPRLAEIAAAQGCRKITILSVPQHPTLRAITTDAGLLRETQTRCQELGVAVESLEGFFITPLTDDAALDAYHAALETAAALAACNINVITSNATKEAPGLSPGERRAHLVQNFAALCDRAAQFGLHVTIELAARAGVKSVPDGVDFMAAVNRPNAGLLVDSLHFYRFNGDVADIRAAGARVTHAQICDGPKVLASEKQIHEAYAQRIEPGAGELALGAFIEALPEQVPLGIEVPRQDLMDAGVAPEERARRAFAATRQLLAAIGVREI